MVKEMAAIVAVASNSNGIGYKGQLPWSLPGDMKHFQKVTMHSPKEGTKNAVIMGRNTWESIPERFRPLKGRTNVVLTRSNKIDGISEEAGNNDAIVANSLDDACKKLNDLSNVGNVFIIGGSRVYEEALTKEYCNKIIYTKVWNLPPPKPQEVDTEQKQEEQQFDAFFPKLDPTIWEETLFHPKSGSETADKSAAAADNEDHKVDKKSGVCYQFYEYKKKVVNLEEMQYLDLCRQILDTGIKRGDRTGTGTLSNFGPQMKFSLRDGTIPVITTKRTFWRGVAEELLWFISGNTNANVLAENDIHIWDGNGSREFLDSRGLGHREVGDLGPVYGFQWRHFGAEYKDMHTDYTGQGVDQLAECIDKIINNPEDRRIIMSAWNPSALKEMALPPCHMFCQFYVDTEKNEVSCLMYQRSADMGLGVPFNIASYALLTHLIAHVTNRKPGDFIHTIGDAHIYLNHVDAIKEQVLRTPNEFPKLKINKNTANIDDIKFGDLELIGYKPQKAIKMKMAV